MLPRIILFLYLLGISFIRAEEGYWLFSDPPSEALSAKYGFTPTPDWLGHLQRAVVFINGATGSFVSADGLVITNHHVGEDQLHVLSSPGHNYEEHGFYAATPGEELPCKGFKFLVLQNSVQVTDRVNAAVKPGFTPAQAEAAQRAVDAEIEKESLAQTGLESHVVTLFGGARYDLYRYKKYTDVRLVFSPEWEMASFGGDPDNFEFPRWDLDICLFRVYQGGKPLNSGDYLAWSRAGVHAGDLVFTAGHPAVSQRLITASELAWQKDGVLPFSVAELERVEKDFEQFGATSPEHKREAGDLLASIANARKAYLGFLAGVRNPALLKKNADDEAHVRALLAASPTLGGALAAYHEVDAAVAADRENFIPLRRYERFGLRSDLFGLARGLVRAVVEKSKPNDERLPGFRDSDLSGLEFDLFTQRPIFDDLETFVLKDSLEQLPVATPEQQALKDRLLAGQSPESRAREIVQGTKVGEVAFRHRVYGETAAELQASRDPLIQLVLALEPAARAARKIDDQDTVAKRLAYGTIYRARVALNQAPAYPDATDTLRLAYGTISGFAVNGKVVAPFTDFAGLYARSEQFHNIDPFHLSKSWVEHQAELNLATPFNFASTNDSLGGNSGSPVVDRKGEFVGILFDGNEPSLAGRFGYDPTVNRSVSVDARGVLEALRHVYHADALAQELETGRRAP